MITQKHVQDWLDAGNTLDPKNLAALCAEDFKMYQPQNSVPLTKESLVPFFSMLWSSFPDMHFEGLGSTIQGNVAASWERVTGTMTGDMTDPSTGTHYKASGKSFNVEAAMKITFDEEGKMTEVHIYWDRMALYKQIGIL